MKKLITLILLTAGLQAGCSNSFTASYDSIRNCLMKEQNKLQEKQIQELKNQNKLLKQIVDVIRKGK